MRNATRRAPSSTPRCSYCAAPPHGALRAQMATIVSHSLYITHRPQRTPPEAPIACSAADARRAAALTRRVRRPLRGAAGALPGRPAQRQQCRATERGADWRHVVDAAGDTPAAGARRLLRRFGDEPATGAGAHRGKRHRRRREQRVLRRHFHVASAATGVCVAV